MPEIYRSGNWSVCVYADDHNPPHFHVVGPDWEVQISLRTFGVMAGEGPRSAISDAIEWARENLDELVQAWRGYNERD